MSVGESPQRPLTVDADDARLPDTDFVKGIGEMLEMAQQAHPELRSRPTRPHPLFKGLVGAAIERQRELRFPIDETGLRREFDDRDDTMDG